MRRVMKKKVLCISCGVSFVCFLILLFVANQIIRGQESQRMAERWSEEKSVAQISCFFSVNAGITEDKIKEFEHSIDTALADASVIQESENPSARLWADAYSADGQITVSTDRSTLQADAIGIGGDFFLFHPMDMLSGFCFSGNDLMQDYCVLDQDAAWQLFGSSDVAGMTVYIGGIPHIVTGVVERESGRLTESAGLDGTLVYVSYQTLSTLGSCNGINHYEIVMPDPVTGFAYNYVSEKLGGSGKETEVIENTSRYSFLSRLKLIPQFGTRSMNGKAILYPYWENVARGCEDILALITLLELLFLTYTLLPVLILLILKWKHKGWTVKEKLLLGKDRLERRGEGFRERRKAGKDGAEKREKKAGKKLKKSEEGKR